MNGEIKTKNPERKDGSSEHSGWDNLAKLAESETWEEHLQKANSLTQKTEELTPTEIRNFLDYDDVARYNKKIFYRDMVRQETLEREFNSELSHVEDLEILADTGDSSVEKTNVRYQDQNISVYILKGYPFKFLGHIINYREGDNISEIGIKTSEELVNDPKKWYEEYSKPKDNELNGGWNIDKKSSRSNTLSTSYVDGTLQGYDRGLAQGYHQHEKSIIYGFDHIRPTTLIYAKNSDGRIPNYIEQGGGYRRGIRTLASSIDEISAGNHDGYNEVAMFRYDDNGRPLEPSFIISDDLGVLLDTESLPERQELVTPNGEQYTAKTNAFYKNRIKQHAAEHKIPIILVDRNAYGDESERYAMSVDKYIAKHYQSALAAGVNPDFVKSKLSAEDAWSNYDTFKKYIPDLDINTEFNNLINARYSQEVAGLGDTSTAEKQRKAYSSVVYGAMVSDVYDFLDRGGDKARLIEMANRTGDAEVVNYTQQLLSSME